RRGGWVLLSALRNRGGEVGVGILGGGLGGGKCWEGSHRHIFGDVLGDLEADLILQTLRRNANGMARQDIFRLFGNHVSSSAVTRALGYLLRTGKVRSETQPTNGRPREMWFAV